MLGVLLKPFCCVSQEPQREQLQALLDNIYGDFVSTVAKARSKTEAEVETMLNEGIYGVLSAPCVLSIAASKPQHPYVCAFTSCATRSLVRVQS